MLSRRAPLLAAAFLIASGLYAQGTSNTNYLTINAFQFNPNDPLLTWEDVPGDGIFLRYATYPIGAFLASVNLPSGALITSLGFDYCNTDPLSDNDEGFALYVTDRLGNTVTLVGDVVGPHNTGCQSAALDLTASNYTVDNLNQRLIAFVRLPSGTNTNQFAGVLIGYKLQVSQPPATPTFNDVPASDPGYQFVEALAASGITGGCGGGSYCPDNPVTRRQMAIFLAKALGLSFTTP